MAAISAALMFRASASGMSWALASVAAPAHWTASLGAIQNFGGYLGGALAPTVTRFIIAGHRQLRAGTAGERSDRACLGSGLFGGDPGGTYHSDGAKPRFISHGNLAG